MSNVKRTTVGAWIAIALPTIVTLAYFILLKDSWLQKPAFLLKLFQFAFPLLWLAYALKERWQDSGIAKLELVDVTAEGGRTSSATWSQQSSIIFGVVMGIAVSLAMWFIYQSIPEAMLADFEKQATSKVKDMELDNATLFIALGILYSLIHSFLEEYYFRWFVFGQLRRNMKFWPAVAIGGLAFMAHHVIILFVFFSHAPSMAIFLSLSIAIGGMIWAWLYEKSGSLVGPWISHMIVDAGIFYIGFVLLRKTAVL